MKSKLQNEVFNILVAIDEFFEQGSSVSAFSLNPFGIDDETMQIAIKRVLNTIKSKRVQS